MAGTTNGSDYRKRTVWIAGNKRFCGDIKMMLGFEPGFYWRGMWLVVTPLAILVSSLISFPFTSASVLAVYRGLCIHLITSWGIICGQKVSTCVGTTEKLSLFTTTTRLQ